MATYTPKSMADLDRFVLQQTMNKVQEIMTKKFYAIFSETFLKYLNKWYGEYNPSVYPRIYEFATNLPVEIKPQIQGKNIVCGIEFDQSTLSHDVWTRFVGGRMYSGYHHGVNEEQAYAIVEDALIYGGHGFWTYTETAPYVETLNELQSNMGLFINELKSELSKSGFIVK